MCFWQKLSSLYKRELQFLFQGLVTISNCYRGGCNIYSFYLQNRVVATQKHYILAEVPGVARGKKENLDLWEKKSIFERKKNYFYTIFFSLCYPRGYSRVPSKNVSPFGPAFWPAIANIYIYIYERRALLYRHTF